MLIILITTTVVILCFCALWAASAVDRTQP